MSNPRPIYKEGKIVDIYFFPTNMFLILDCEDLSLYHTHGQEAKYGHEILIQSTVGDLFMIKAEGLRCNSAASR